MNDGDWWLILYFGGLLVVLATIQLRTKRMIQPPRPRLLKIERADDMANLKVTMRPLAAPADQPSYTGYRGEATDVAGAAVPTGDAAFDASLVFTVPEATVVNIGYRYLAGDRPGPLGPLLTFSAALPGPTTAPPIPEVQTIELAPA